jgi:hypothetical protein
LDKKYKSSGTSVNSGKLPAIVHIWDYYIISGLTVLDYGCGKYDNTREYLESKGAKYFGYDPFNRTEEENNLAMKEHNYDRAILSNVLNVIAEKKVRLQIMYDIKKHLAPNGVLYIKIYEGNGSGVMKVNEKKNSCQLNLKTREYLPEVASVFGFRNVRTQWINGIHVIVAENGAY